MTYTVTNIQNKQSTKGTQYQKATFTDMNGQVFENVTVFGMIIKNEGQALDGFLNSEIYNGKTQYTFKVTDSVKPSGKTAQMEHMMEKKNESIQSFQDNKEKSIQTAGAITNATNIVVALINAKAISPENWQTKLREYITFYKRMYEHPELIAPKGDSPMDYDALEGIAKTEDIPW